jgi:hypothetical protein
VASALSNTQVWLTWFDNSSKELGFRIERRTSHGGFAQIATVGADVMSYADHTVSPETTYTYRVKAYNSLRQSSYSNEATITTDVVALPATPGDVRATVVSGSRVDVSWHDRSHNEDGFRVDRRAGGGAFAFLASVGANVTGYADTTVVAYTTYTYRVRAFNGGGESLSAVSPSVTPPNGPGPLPAAPCCLTASPQRGNGGPFVSLGWVDQGGDAVGFRVERAEAAGGWTLLSAVPASTTAVDDYAVAPGTLYRYRVVAWNANGASASGEVQVTTPAR